MERLPYIDEHAITVGAGRADTWSALLRVLCRDPADPSTAPRGFVVDEARAPARFALRGRHPFAVYRWVFELEDQAGRTRVRAATWAAFPGAHGTVYRALVIGTGAHRAVTRWTLKRVASAAERSDADYADVFEVPLPQGDSRTAEETFRDAVGRRPGAAGGLVRWIHRHVLRFDLGRSPGHPIGWTVVRSDRDAFVLTATGPLMEGELALRRLDDRRASLTTRVHYRRRVAARAVWAVVGPLHRAVAPRLMKRAAVWQRVPA